MGVAHARTHALSHELRRHVRRVAGEQHPAVAPALGDQRVEGVDEPPQHLDLVDVDVPGEEPAHRRRILHLLLGLARHQQELEAVVAVRLRAGDGRLLRIAVEVEIGHVAEAVLALLRLDVDDEPRLGKALAGHLDAEAGAHAAAAAVAGDEPLRPRTNGLARGRRVASAAWP